METFRYGVTGGNPDSTLTALQHGFAGEVTRGEVRIGYGGYSGKVDLITVFIDAETPEAGEERITGVLPEGDYKVRLLGRDGKDA